MRASRGMRLVVAMLLGGCARERDLPAIVEIADSAGVRVVINPPPETAPEWRVAESPELEIGTRAPGRRRAGDDPAYLLYQVEGAARLSDGKIVVANRGTAELRFYAPEGQLVLAAGGRGDGPTEFRDIRLVGILPDDSVMVSDVRSGSISVYDRAGRLARRQRYLVSVFGIFPSPVGVLSDGSTMLRPGSTDRPENEVFEGGVRRPIAEVVIAGPDGAERRSLGRFPLGETHCLPDERPGHGCKVGGPVPFSRRLSWSAGKDRIALASSDSFSVRILDASGAPIQVVRQRRKPMEVREADREGLRQRAREYLPPTLVREVLDAMDAMPRYDTYPAFAGLRLDREGRLWVEESRRPDDDRSVWQVFDREGLLIGRLRAPEGLRITDSGADYVLGVATDEMEVERVRLYRFERPTATSG